MLTRSKRGALVYVREEQSKREKMARVAVVIIAVAGLLLFGLPGDPMHGASKYQATGCAGLIECAQEWGEDGGEYQEEEGAPAVHDYRGRA